MDFEWDNAKDNTNRAKHGYDFDTASKIFLGNVIARISPYEKERRVIATGKYEGRFITVIYTMRGSARRIISAWVARRKETIMGRIIRKTLKEVANTKGNTNWEKVDSITDEELDELVKNDPDDVYLTDEDFASGK